MTGTNDCCPSTPKLPDALRVAGWNALLLTAGLALITIAAEAYIGLTPLSMTEVKNLAFDPEVGILYTPTQTSGSRTESIFGPHPVSTTGAFLTASLRTRSAPWNVVSSP